MSRASSDLADTSRTGDGEERQPGFRYFDEFQSVLEKVIRREKTRFLEALRNAEYEEHEEYLEWICGEFDPEPFDTEAVNRVLAAGGAIREHGVGWVQTASPGNQST